jgi:hypothetical protein
MTVPLVEQAIASNEKKRRRQLPISNTNKRLKPKAKPKSYSVPQQLARTPFR